MIESCNNNTAGSQMSPNRNPFAILYFSLSFFSHSCCNLKILTTKNGEETDKKKKKGIEIKEKREINRNEASVHCVGKKKKKLVTTFLGERVVHSMHQWVPMRWDQMHSGRLAMRRPLGLRGSQRRDWMRRVRRLLLFLFVLLCLHHQDREEAHPGEEHRLQVALALRGKKMYVGEPHLRRGDGLSLGSGWTILL